MTTTAFDERRQSTSTRRGGYRLPCRHDELQLSARRPEAAVRDSQPSSLISGQVLDEEARRRRRR